MDDIATFNRARWNDLAEARAIFTRPWLELTAERARTLLDPHKLLGSVRDRDVLCLGSGGGQQAVAFALLGARVTSIDISSAQVARDVETAQHYGVTISAVEGDMRDLSRLDVDSFDVVHHAYSINFVPDPTVVFEGVARVLRPRGCYQLFFANPFSLGLTRSDWVGNGYTIRHPYVQGNEVRSENPAWFFRDESPTSLIDGPIEYCHTLSTIVNGLASCQLSLVRLTEVCFGDPDLSAEPGTREHLSAFVPRWLDLSAIYLPDVLHGAADDVTG